MTANSAVCAYFADADISTAASKDVRVKSEAGAIRFTAASSITLSAAVRVVVSN